MYFEEEPNQNPKQSSDAKEENTNTVSKTGKSLEEKEPKQATAEKQISQNEKEEIAEALSGAESNETAEIETEVSKSSAVQLLKNEKDEIVNLLKDTAVKQAEEKVVVEKIVDQKEKTQISKSEKKEIVNLLSDKFQTETGKSDNIDEEIDYHDLNKQELVELFEETVQEKDVSIIRTKVGHINKAFHQINKEDKEKELHDFIANGGVKEEYKHNEDPLEQRFRQAFNQYKHNKSKFGEELEKQKAENLKLKNGILEDLKSLIDSEETLKKTYDEFNRLQDRWKEIGMVPAGELNNLWQNYHFLVELFFDKVRINKELRDLDLKKNREQKIALCEKAEELYMEKSIIKSFKSLQQFHDEWREIGPVPSENREELWERFKAATDKINTRRKEHYKELQAEQETSYEAKVALCDKLEEMLPQEELSLKEWQKKTDQINELFKVWKTIGRAPKAKNDEIWIRFKSSLDKFFLSKREFLGKLKDQQMNNLNLKIDLCVQAEAIKDSEDWKKTTNDLIRLQKEWKGIGPVPRRQSDKVWKRFRGACDEFFNRKSDFFKNIHVVEGDNLKSKKDLLKEINDYKISKDKGANMEALRGFQRRWMDIGHVPFKEKDKLQHEYREAVDALIDKMDINKSELTQSGFKNKIEMLKNDPDAEWRLKKERNYLFSKISKIKEDVALWENNIGFFSNSKQSDVLRKEFEHKIEKAKKEIEDCQDKMKLLNEI